MTVMIDYLDRVWREVFMTYYNVLLQHLSGGAVKIQKMFRSRWLVSGPKSEPDISQI
jgi:hypothetical protein